MEKDPERSRGNCACEKLRLLRCFNRGSKRKEAIQFAVNENRIREGVASQRGIYFLYRGDSIRRGAQGRQPAIHPDKKKK